MTKHSFVLKLVFCALFTALIFVGTQFIKVPLVVGYFNLGDVFILLAGYFIGGWHGALCCATGAVTADILSGYIIYVPATAVIKAAMAFTLFLICKNKKTNPARFVVGAIISETIMVIGYFIYESLLFDFSGAVASLPANLLQGAACVVISSVVLMFLNRTKILKQLNI